MDRKPKNQRKLSRAIQDCIVDIVDKMPFTQSEIPDTLIQDGCITEDECIEIRGKPNRKDQVRKLVLLIKGRSFDIMQKYLDAIEIHCPAAFEKVWNQYSLYVKDKARARNCPFCEMKEYVDVKYVSDFLYGKQVIQTGLYTQICDSINPTSQQDALWDLTIQACSGGNLKYLVEVLMKKGHYTHIAESLRIFLGRCNSNYTCSCSIKRDILAPSNMSGDESESSATCSPQSSVHTSFSADEEITTPKEIINETMLGSELSIQSSLSKQSVETVIATNQMDEINIDDADDRLFVTENPVKGNLDNGLYNVTFEFKFLCLRCCKRYESDRPEVLAFNKTYSKF